MGCMVHSGLFHPLVDSGCAWLDPNPVICTSIPSFSFFFLLVVVSEFPGKIDQICNNKLPLGFNILDEKKNRRRNKMFVWVLFRSSAFDVAACEKCRIIMAGCTLLGLGLFLLMKKKKYYV